jgi:menaquinone-dependent protoporphyrinogen oxidase
MHVLVAVGCRHGATTELANQLAAELRFHGLEVDVHDAARVDGLDGYDAVVVGSAVYMGRWLPSARAFVERFRSQLRSLPVWIFSSGPLGDPPVPDETPQHHQEIAESLAVRGDHVFGGRLDPAQLSFGERLITKAVHTPSGDFRDGLAVKRWARAIKTDLFGNSPKKLGPVSPVRSGLVGQGR